MERGGEDRCPRCGGPVDDGFLAWCGYPLRWRNDARRWGFQVAGEPLLRPRGLGAPREPARRCRECRLVWFHY